MQIEISENANLSECVEHRIAETIMALGEAQRISDTALRNELTRIHANHLTEALDFLNGLPR